MITVIFDHQLFSLQRFGGATRYLMNLAQEFILNPEVQLECQLGLYEKSAINASVYPAIRGIPEGVFTPKHRLLRFSINEIFSYLYKLTANAYDGQRVHHCTYIYPPHQVPKTPLIVTHYDCTVEKFQDQFRRSSMTIKLKQNIYRQADRIIAISNNSKIDLMEFYAVPESKIQVVYPGVERPLPLEAAASPAGIGLHPYILYIGARTFYKNFNGLLKAYARSKARSEFRIVAVGGGVFTPSEAALIQELGIDENVTSFPYASQSELAWLYYNAHGMVYPSMYEGFGFPPLEAMSMSCPTLVSNSSCLPEVLGEGPLYFESGNDDDLSDKLDMLCYNSELRTSLIRKGEAVVKFYTWSESANNTLSVYKNALQ